MHMQSECSAFCRHLTADMYITAVKRFCNFEDDIRDFGAMGRFRTEMAKGDSVVLTTNADKIMQFHEYNGKAESSLHSGMQGRAGFLQSHRNGLDLMHVCLIKN